MSRLIKLCHWLLGNNERVTRSGICWSWDEKAETEASLGCKWFTTGSSESSAWGLPIEERAGSLMLTTSFPLAKESTFEAPENNNWFTLIKKVLCYEFSSFIIEIGQEKTTMDISIIFCMLYSNMMSEYYYQFIYPKTFSLWPYYSFLKQRYCINHINKTCFPF